MKVDKYKRKEVFRSEDGDDDLSVSYTNRGDPYSEGIELELGDSWGSSHVFIYLERQEALRLAKLITDLYG